METKENPVMVSISCITYNQEKYIRDALNGFVMQKTNFRYEAIVHDDCSTDHTADIVREYAEKYPDIIKPIYEEENQYSKGVNSQMGAKIDAMTHGKYIALCEGDDYWTDPLKLQKQVDFLESHPEYSMCFHRTRTKAEGHRDKHEENKFEFLREGEYTREDQLRMMRIVPTCSILIRSNIYRKRPRNKKFTIGDLVVVATALTYGRIYCLGDEMAVYRLIDSGWTARTNKSECYSMVSHYQGMIESFNWYRCKLGYRSLKFWTFSLLTMLKDEHEMSEFQRIATNYRQFFHVNNMLAFDKYYFDRKSRAAIRKIFGPKLTQLAYIIRDKFKH